MRTINIKKLLTFILILLSICVIISPVNATIVNIDYQTELTSETISCTAPYSENTQYDWNIDLDFPEMESWKNIKSVVYALDYTLNDGRPQWVCRDLNVHTSQVPVIYKIGGVPVSSGTIQFIRHLNSYGALTGGTLTYTFDSIIDTSSHGVQRMTCDYVLTDLNIAGRHVSAVDGIIIRTGNCPIMFCRKPTPFTIDSGVAYKYSNFHTSFEYDYCNSFEQSIDFSLYRNSEAYYTLLIGKSETIIIDDISEDDISLYDMYDIPYTLNITNPAYSGSGLGEFFEYIIPEDVSTTNIATLSWYAYNKEATGTEVIGTNYNLQIRNETDLTWSAQSTGYNPSYSNLEIPNNAYYNMSLTAPNYESLDDYTFSVSGDKTLSFGLYPEYGDNFSVNFQVRGFSGERIEAAKITLNDIIKYTPYNGMVGFGDISGYINYEISKTGYVSVSGNKTITENTEMYIIMKTEEQALEDDDEDEDEDEDEDILGAPTNLLESIQYAFQKMFGLSSSPEDMEVANLLMGLGVIFAGAVLIASITKDALGAVVGGLIGFIMALALGFIPLWVVFVGFSAFAIYIILTRTGGSE